MAWLKHTHPATLPPGAWANMLQNGTVHCVPPTTTSCIPLIPRSHTRPSRAAAVGMNSKTNTGALNQQQRYVPQHIATACNAATMHCAAMRSDTMQPHNAGLQWWHMLMCQMCQGVTLPVPPFKRTPEKGRNAHMCHRMQEG